MSDNVLCPLRVFQLKKPQKSGRQQSFDAQSGLRRIENSLKEISGSARAVRLKMRPEYGKAGKVGMVSSTKNKAILTIGFFTLLLLFRAQRHNLD